MATANLLLDSVRINRAIERIRVAPTPLSDHFGWSNATGNVDPIGGRDFRYDFFERTKDLAAGRAPGSPPARVPARPVGAVAGRFPRHHEKIVLDDEIIHNQRRVGGPQGELDLRGENYIAQQLQHMADKFRNVIEFQTAAMLRGQYDLNLVGDDLDPVFTGGDSTINFNIPAGNQAQLNATGGGDIIDVTWLTSTTNIPLHCMQVNEASQELTGRPITDVFVGTAVWDAVISNDDVRNVGGTSNTVFESITRDANGNFTAIVRAIPWLTWHIVTTVLEVAGTNVNMIEDNHAIFLPPASRDWVSLGLGSEVVTEGPNGPRTDRMGQYFWSYPGHEPSGWNIVGVYNGLPNLYVPSAIFDGTVIF